MVPLLTPFFEGNILTQGFEISSRKTRIFGTVNSEDFVILACSVLIGLKGVIDGQTDGQTPSPVAMTRRA